LESGEKRYVNGKPIDGIGAPILSH
jgi:hypothetical protein